MYPFQIITFGIKVHTGDHTKLPVQQLLSCNPHFVSSTLDACDAQRFPAAHTGCEKG